MNPSIQRLILWLENEKEHYRLNLKVVEEKRATPKIEAEIEAYEYIENLVNNL